MLTKNSHGWNDCGPTEAKHAQVIFKTEAAACVALKMHGMMSASFEAQLQHCSCAEAKRPRHGLARARERNQGSGGRFRGSKLGGIFDLGVFGRRRASFLERLQIGVEVGQFLLAGTEEEARGHR